MKIAFGDKKVSILIPKLFWYSIKTHKQGSYKIKCRQFLKVLCSSFIIQSCGNLNKIYESQNTKVNYEFPKLVEIAIKGYLPHLEVFLEVFNLHLFFNNIFFNNIFLNNIFFNHIFF